MGRFANKVALITGASRGIGRAVALEFAKEGANIFGIYSGNHEMAYSLSSELNQVDVECEMFQADISKPDQVESLKEAVASKFNSIDVLVNNAGIVYDISFEDCTLEEWKRTFDVNVFGTFLCTKILAPLLKDGSAIVNVSSTSGLSVFTPESMAYDGSKASVSSITHGMAKEFSSRKIRVNAVAPGWVDTDMNSELPEAFLADSLAQIYLKRMAKPIEIARTILFLASEDASFVNGVTLVADGGVGQRMDNHQAEQNLKLLAQFSASRFYRDSALQELNLIMQNVPGFIVILGSPNDIEGNLSPIGVGRVEQGYTEYVARRDAGWKILLTGGFGNHFNTTDNPNAYYAQQILFAKGVLCFVPTLNHERGSITKSFERIAGQAATLIVQ